MRMHEPFLALKVDAHSPSGDGCFIGISPVTPISELKAAAQQHFQRRFKLTAKGRQLDSTATLSEAGLRDGDAVTAVVQLGHLAATENAFAWHGHEVVTWGHPDFGGDSSQVQDQLRNVQSIQATQCAFAAILESGSVLILGSSTLWRRQRSGSGSVRNVQSIQATGRAFAAILESGAEECPLFTRNQTFGTRSL